MGGKGRERREGGREERGEKVRGGREGEGRRLEVSKR